MGKKRPVVIDDSQPVEEVKKPERKKILGTNIERDQKLKQADEPTPEFSAEKKETT
jgi:hypothetical protein